MANIDNVSDNEAHSSEDDVSPIKAVDTSFILPSSDRGDSSADEDEEEEDAVADASMEDEAVSLRDDPLLDDNEDTLSEILPSPAVEGISQPLTIGEVAALRAMMRKQISATQQVPSSKTNEPKENDKKFRVPKEHPVFNGDADKLEAFIVEMELTHAKETSGSKGDKHNPEFITKLIPYFKAESAGRIWFKMYASRRIRAGMKLTWKRLVRDLRASYGVFDQPDIQFEDYYEMSQKNDDVKTYIAKKCEAALMSEDLTPRLLKFGFIRGLNPEIRKYVKLQKPETLEAAQRTAIDYENSIKGKVAVKKSVADGQRGRGSGRGSGSDGASRTEPASRKRPNESTASMSNEQIKALDELRMIRRNKCFGCGLEGHRREACKADKAVVKKHQDLIASLKTKINGA